MFDMVVTEETAAERIAPPGSAGAAIAAPVATAPAAVSRPAFTRSPKSVLGVWRSTLMLVDIRTGLPVGSMRLMPAMTASSFPGIRGERFRARVGLGTHNGLSQQTSAGC